MPISFIQPASSGGGGAPAAHKSSHATGGSDAISAGDINAAAASHTHGNVTNDGKIGSAANLPVITTTAGALTTGTFGTAANSFCEGNDSRLSDARTPTSHTHGNVTNDGKIGSSANLPVITTTAGALTTGSFGTSANSFCEGNDSRLSDARTPTSHSHGNITNAGAIGSTTDLPVITTTGGVLTTGAFGTSAGQFCQGNDSRLSDSRTPTAHKASHQTGGSDALSPADIGAPASSTTGITGATAVSNIVFISQANYDSIGSPNSTTLYVIV